MRIITGDECGLLKETIPEHGRRKQKEELKQSFNSQDGVCRIDPTEMQSRSRGVVNMAFLTDSTRFAALRVNGSVQLWNGNHEEKTKAGQYSCIGTVDRVFEENTDVSKARPIAIDALQKQSRLCAANSLGQIAVLKSDSSDMLSVVTRYTPFEKQTSSTITYTKGQYVNTNLATAMAVDSIHGRVAVGGRERETTLLNVETGHVVWKAKNLPPHPQTLLQYPIWPTALLFLDSASYHGGSNQVMVTGTAYKQVRLYDVRTNDSTTRRPIAYTPEGLLEHRVTALCQVDAHELVVGDTAGYVYALDMRTLGRKRKGSMNLARFVGPCGSIRKIVKHATLNVIACVGLDRMLRTYNTKTRKQLDCVYLKQRLNCALFCKDESWSTENDDNDAMFDDGDVNAQDKVQDYVDSDNEESSDGSKREGQVDDESDSTDSDTSEDNNDSDESEHSDLDSESEDEESEQEEASSKRRRRL